MLNNKRKYLYTLFIYLSFVFQEEMSVFLKKEFILLLYKYFEFYTDR